MKFSFSQIKQQAQSVFSSSSRSEEKNEASNSTSVVKSSAPQDQKAVQGKGKNEADRARARLLPQPDITHQKFLLAQQTMELGAQIKLLREQLADKEFELDFYGDYPTKLEAEKAQGLPPSTPKRDEIIGKHAERKQAVDELKAKLDPLVDKFQKKRKESIMLGIKHEDDPVRMEAWKEMLACIDEGRELDFTHPKLAPFAPLNFSRSSSGSAPLPF